MIYCRLERKCFFDFIEAKKQLVLFDWSNNSGVIDVKMDSPVFEEASSFKM